MYAAMITLVFAIVVHAAAPVYKVRLTANEDNRIVELDAEAYVGAVLAGESSVFHSDEALKAMAVTVRTWAAHERGRHAAEGFDFCATTHCQRAEPSAVDTRLQQATRGTRGELLWFEGRLAFTPYTRSCGGQTERVEAVWPDISAPYLSSQVDSYCARIAESRWSWTVRPEQIVDALQKAHLQTPSQLREIRILNRTSSGRVRVVELEGTALGSRLSASSLRFAIGRTVGWNTIRSERFSIANRATGIQFDGSGEGHGVGLCQRGADEMGRRSSTYREILAFYFPGTKVGLTGAGLPWTRIGGEHISLLTTRPDQDRSVLAIAENTLQHLSAELPNLRWPDVAIRIYPDLESFRNATGEPGWVAGRTEGSTIDLQPVRELKEHHALESTIRHEFLHVAIEQAAAPSTPLWFREGLVACLARQRAAGAEPVSEDGLEIAQRNDSQAAHEAYRAAQVRVAAMLQRYGAAVLFKWLESDLPTEVANSSASMAPTKSR